MGLGVLGICKSIPAHLLTKVQRRSRCAHQATSVKATLDHVLDCQWRERLHQGAILSLFLHKSTELGEGRLSLLSSSSDAQLLMTCFGALAAADASEAELEVVERRTLCASESGGPIFSMGVAPHHGLFFAGTAEREIRAWRISDWNPVLEVALGGHTGWVRALSVCNKFMISAACNFIMGWELPGNDKADPIASHTGEPTNPIKIKHLGDLQLFKGDVLVAAVGNSHVYAATADGMLHVWTFSQSDKHLAASSFRKMASVQAHEGMLTTIKITGRVGALAIQDETVVSTGHDGIIRVWCSATMRMKAEAQAAHGGSKVHALATSGTLLFSGGADKCVRVWNLETLAPIGEPVRGHAATVRSLVATSHTMLGLTLDAKLSPDAQGRGGGSNVHGLLASGDAHGEVILWHFLKGNL